MRTSSMIQIGVVGDYPQVSAALQKIWRQGGSPGVVLPAERGLGVNADEEMRDVPRDCPRRFATQAARLKARRALDTYQKDCGYGIYIAVSVWEGDSLRLLQRRDTKLARRIARSLGIVDLVMCYADPKQDAVFVFKEIPCRFHENIHEGTLTSRRGEEGYPNPFSSRIDDIAYTIGDDNRDGVGSMGELLTLSIESVLQSKLRQLSSAAV